MGCERRRSRAIIKDIAKRCWFLKSRTGKSEPVAGDQLLISSAMSSRSVSAKTVDWTVSIGKIHVFCLFCPLLVSTSFDFSVQHGQAPGKDSKAFTIHFYVIYVNMILFSHFRFSTVDAWMNQQYYDVLWIHPPKPEEALQGCCNPSLGTFPLEDQHPVNHSLVSLCWVPSLPPSPQKSEHGL